MTEIDRGRAHLQASVFHGVPHVNLAVPDARHEIERRRNVNARLEPEIRIADLDLIVSYMNVTRRRFCDVAEVELDRCVAGGQLIDIEPTCEVAYESRSGIHFIGHALIRMAHAPFSHFG